MLSRLFARRATITVQVLGQVGRHMVRWTGPVRVSTPADVKAVLHAAGRAAGADLLGALAAGMQPALLLDGRRLDLPADLTAPVADGSRLSWLMPMAGG
jgi:hypothetical protein